mgnify:CR=1 FL=1
MLGSRAARSVPLARGAKDAGGDRRSARRQRGGVDRVAVTLLLGRDERVHTDS